MDPLENWFDLRSQLIWAYDGPAKISRSFWQGNPVAAWFVRQGTLTLTYGHRQTSYAPGGWVFPCAREGWHEFSEDAHILSIRFISEWPTGQPFFERSRTVTLSGNEGAKLLQIGTRLARLVQRNFPGDHLKLRRAPGLPCQYFELLRLFNGWMLAYTEAMVGKGFSPQTTGLMDDRVREAVHQMEMQKINAPMREGPLAAGVGLSISQLNRLFVRDVGKTPSDYWEEKRMASARRALAESRQSIKSIAYDLGFSSLPHFSRWITKKFGVSPKALRQAWKHGNGHPGNG